MQGTTHTHTHTQVGVEIEGPEERKSRGKEEGGERGCEAGDAERERRTESHVWSELDIKRCAVSSAHKSHACLCLGSARFGLCHLHESSPGDPGLQMGSNWTDRRGDKCTWYLESDQGDIFEGRLCLAEGPSSHVLLPGDVISVELIDGLATFSVNYKPYATDIRVDRFPVAFGALMVWKGDKVSLLRNERMSSDEYLEWMQSRSERAEKWRAVTHKRIQSQQQEAALLQQDLQQQKMDKDRERERQREMMDVERQRVESMIAEQDREREERKRRERRERGEDDNTSSFGKVVSSIDYIQMDSGDGWESKEETFDEVVSPSGTNLTGQEDELERLRRERDEAKMELERTRLELQAVKARGSSPRDVSLTEVDEGSVEVEGAARDGSKPDKGADASSAMVEGLALVDDDDDDEYEGGDYMEAVDIPDVVATGFEYEQHAEARLDSPKDVCGIAVCMCFLNLISFLVLVALNLRTCMAV